MSNSVSVICPLYKGEKYVSHIVRMIYDNMIELKDLYKVELIFVNDFPDEEIVIEQEYDWINLVINFKNEGIHQSRVNGLKVAKGEYILFLDQDDEISEKYLKSQLTKIQNADAIICNGYWRNGKRIYQTEEEQSQLILGTSLFPYIVSPGQALIRREAIPIEWCDNIMYNNGCDDALLWNMMRGKNKVFANNLECLYEHVENVDNASANYRGMYDSLKECFDIMLSLAFFSEERVKEIMEWKSKKLTQYSSYIRLSEALKRAYMCRERIIGRLIGDGIKDVAIYGYGYFGQCIETLFANSEIKIKYVVDRDKSKYKQCEIIMVSPEEAWPQCDMIIVTPILNYEEIELYIKKKVCERIKIKNVLEVLAENEC